MRSRLAAGCLAGLLASVTLAGRQTLPGWFDLSVQGGASTLAALGIPIDERALTLSLLARALYDRETPLMASPTRVTGLVAATTTPAVGADTDREFVDIPVPLDADTWRRLLGLNQDDDLFARFLTDRNALFLAAALTATDDSIRALVVRDRDLLRFLYREAAGSFVLASRFLRVRDERVVVPGGADAAAIWGALAGESVARPAAFIRALLARDQGRLAWYFDTMAGSSDERLELAWPTGPREARLAHARALYESFRDADPHWRAAQQPFRRNVADAWFVIALTDVADGRLAGPAAAALWDLLFESGAVQPDTAKQLLTRDPTPLTMAALVRATALSPTRERRRRFEMFRLAQRAFPDASAADAPAIAVALSGYEDFRSLLLALERMGVTTADTWARVVTTARLVSDAGSAHESLTVFQGAIALIDRLRHVRVLDFAAADGLLRALGDAVRADRPVRVAVARWLTASLIPALPPLERPDAWTGATAYESRILQALAGRRDRQPRSLDWEGIRYRVDLVDAEQARLRAVRLKVLSPGLDAALADGNSRQLSAALMALVYTVSLGHADGAVALSRDVAMRHDFGLRSPSLIRKLLPWSPPEERQGAVPWHVAGSLIGLDGGLSRLALRRVADEQMPMAPTLTLNDFATLTRTIGALVPTELTDTDRDALAAAIERGRARVADARDAAALDALAGEVRMSAAARQLLPWMVSRHAVAVAGCFSLRDLLWLGRPTVSRAVLDRWGVAADAIDGRRSTMMLPPAPWEDFAGRADAGQMATQVPDVTLRLVEETARLELPAMLVPALLAYAIDDYWHDAQTRFADDWPRMTRQAAAIETTRIEDYVAALVGDGVLRPQ